MKLNVSARVSEQELARTPRTKIESFRTPTHEVDGSRSLSEIANAFRTLYRVYTILDFEFAAPDLGPFPPLEFPPPARMSPMPVCEDCVENQCTMNCGPSLGVAPARK